MALASKITALASKRLSTRAAWILSYAVLCAVPIVISCAVYASAVSLLGKQLDESNALIVALFGKELDEKLESVQRLASDIAWDQRLIYIMNKPELSEAEVRFSLAKLAEAMAISKSYDRYATNVFIYFPAFDQVLTPQAFYPLKVFYDNHAAGTALDEGRFRELLAARHSRDSVPIDWIDDRGARRDLAVYLWTLPMGNAGDPEATIAIVIDMGSIIDSIKSTVKTAHSDIVITNDSGEVLASTLPEAARSILGRVDEPRAAAITKVRAEGRSYTVMQRSTSRMGWTIRLLVPASALEAKLVLTKTITLVGIGLSLALCGILTIFLFRRNYRPLERTVRTALRASGLEGEGQGDEFAIIRDAVTLVSEGKRVAEARFERSVEQLREHAIDRMLKGRESPGMPLEESMAALGIEFASERFLVLIVDIDEEGPGPYARAREIAHREFARRLGDMALLYRSSDPDCLAYLASLKSELFAAAEGQDVREPGEVLRKAIAEAAATLRQEARLEVACASSLVVEGKAQIPAAFAQAQEAREYRFVVGGADPICYGELPSSVNGLSYRFDSGEEARLFNTIASGDLQACVRIVDDIFASNAEALRSPTAAKRLAWDLGASLMKAITETLPQGPETEKLIDAVADLPKDKDILEVRQGVSAILEVLCREAGEKVRAKAAAHKARAMEGISTKIQEYLAGHLSDPSLNLEKISDDFAMTPVYLSRLFREYQHEGVHDCLNRLRVEKAKALLKDADRTLPDIGMACGFASVNTFIRVFKKSTGLSPGKYRETLTR
jgi:Response regulator containing CheY-like receiver domain and AraC-type DNA-binding domain